MHCSSIGKDASLSRWKDEFDSHTVYQKLSVLSARLDGRAWNSEAAGSNPATQTKCAALADVVIATV